VEWTPADRHGNRELQDLPEDLVRLFSKRSDQIDPEVERLESSGRERTPRLVKWAVHATRKPKEHEAPDTLYGRWRTEAAERGQDPDTLVRQVTGRTREQDLVVSEGTVAEVFDRLAGPDGLTAQASTFARQDVLAAVGGQLAGASRAELEDLADRFCTERAVAVVADRARRSAAGPPPTSLHAGELEVSLLLHAYPELVADGYQRADQHADPRPHLLVTGMRGYTETGVIGRPSLATAEKGRAVLDSLTRSFKEHLALLS
jgi:Creatinine amidohydrolase/TrwC relaxase